MSERGMEIELIARAVILHGDRALLCRNLKHGYRYLPGGHVEFAESAPDALMRELSEEAGLMGNVVGFVLAEEQVFRQGGTIRHEVNLVFHVELDDPPGAAIESKEAKIAFEWVRLGQLRDHDVRPVSTYQWLPEFASAPRLWVPRWLSSTIAE